MMTDANRKELVQMLTIEAFGRPGTVKIPVPYIALMRSYDGAAILSHIIQTSYINGGGWLVGNGVLWVLELDLPQHVIQEHITRMTTAGYLQTKTVISEYSGIIHLYKFDAEIFTDVVYEANPDYIELLQQEARNEQI